METCGAVADFDAVEGKLTLWTTTQAPHAHRTLYAIVAGLPEHKIRVISPDIGGGFGNKVPIYPGYVCAIVGSLLTGKPVKWMEDRSENLTQHRLRARLRHARRDRGHEDGKILAIRTNVLADHGAFNGTAAPVKYPAGFFGVFTGSYDLEAAYCKMTAVYTNKAPGGVAYACSFRITEASTWSSDRRLPRVRARDGPGRAAAAQPDQARAVPVHDQDRLGLRLRATTSRRCARRCGSPATTSCAGSRPRSASAAS
jgi:carbon-monoxide dehydrogenase large subunit